MSKFSRDQITKACEMRERGVSQNIIARHTGIPVNSLDYVFKRYGADSPRLIKNTGKRRYPTYLRNGIEIRAFNDDEDQYLTEMQDSAGLAEMARHLSRPTSSVRNRILILARLEARREAQQEAA